MQKTRLMTLRPAMLLLGSLVWLAGSACTTEEAVCYDYAAAGLNVRVVEETTGEPMCSVQVTATDGDYFEALRQSENRGNCSYSGAVERPGTYRIAVSKEGYVSKTVDDVVVTTEPECGHVVGQVIEVVLSPG